MNSTDATHLESYEGWQFLYFISRQSEDRGFVGVAEIQKQGQLYCKLVSLSPERVAADASDGLRLQCEAWVADWATRPHSGDTDLMPLE